MEANLFLLVYAVIGIAIYFLPAFIASQRNHRNAGAIFILNIFLGWTFLGWVISLIWSLTYQAPRTPAELARDEEARKLAEAQMYGQQTKAIDMGIKKNI